MCKISAGVASVDITPEPGLPLMGNFRDDYAARGTHDPLLATATVFADRQGTTIAILSVDVCMLDRQNVAFMREVIYRDSKIPPENVLIHAAHTHSGPAVSGRLGMDIHVAAHRAAIETCLRKAASAVALASQNLAEVNVEIGRARVDGIAFNRRLRRRDGTTQMNWEALSPGFDATHIVEPWGPVDPELLTLGLRGTDGRLATAVNFGLHPAILAGDNWLYSADYPGRLRDSLAEQLGGDGTCQFLNGCCGDVNHVDYGHQPQGRGFEMVQRVGAALADAAVQAASHATTVRPDPLRVTREFVPLQRLKITADEIDRCERILEQARVNPPQGQVDGVPDVYFARLWQQMHGEQAEPDPVEVMAIRIGELAVVGLPGEAFCQLGLDIKRRSPAACTVVTGLANDAIGYLPTRDAFAQGGYETTKGSTFYEPGSAERMVDSAVSQLERLFAT